MVSALQLPTFSYQAKVSKGVDYHTDSSYEDRPMQLALGGNVNISRLN